METTIQLLPKNSSLGHPKTLCNSFNSHELCEIPKGLNATLVIEDMFPTILEIAGVEFGGQSGALFNDDGTTELGPDLDGQSFAPLLRGEAGNPDRLLYWHFPHAWGGLTSARARGPGIGATSTIRRGDWKLVYWHVDGRKELFNLRSDIGEQRNLASDEPELVADLSASLSKFLRETNAIMPSRKATGEPVPYPDES